mgnify:CR=1 FL=1
MKILIIEDDSMIGDSLQKALRKSGYVVDWVQDGENVLLYLGSTEYDLMILDLGLPGEDGLLVKQSRTGAWEIDRDASYCT